MAIVLSVLPFTQTQWPPERRVKGRKEKTRAIRKRVNGRTDKTMATRKKSKWKDRQHNGHQKEG
jgi:hypothetical protein